MDKFLFELKCTDCGTETRLLVLWEDEFPAFCPMCGSAETFNAIDEDDTIEDE